MTVKELEAIFRMCPDNAEIIIDKGYELKEIAKVKLEMNWDKYNEQNRVFLAMEK